MTERKMAHINLAARSIPESLIPDQRFNYEPLLSGHTQHSSKYSFWAKARASVVGIEYDWRSKGRGCY